MIISVINHTNLSDAEVQRAIRAINIQIEQDFFPYWSIGATLRLEGRLSMDPDLKNPAASMRGDAVLYLEDKFGPEDPFGFHDLHFSGIPFGFVYTQLAEEMKEPWPVTLSHEALELIADAEVNRLVMGPHPKKKENGRLVFHWYEMCDAVQDEHYEVAGVPVSNFVLPLYFTFDAEPGSRNDFLGTERPDGSRLPSFGINPGGYVGFYDPKKNKHDTSFADRRAEKRALIKSKMGFARRGIRYKSQVNEPLQTGRNPETQAKPIALITGKGGRTTKPSKASTRGAVKKRRPARKGRR